MTFQKGNRFGKRNTVLTGNGLRAYRCVYCKKRFTDLTQLPSHEAQCPFRAVVRMQWASAIENAKRRERGK